MNVQQKRKILIKIQTIEKDIDILSNTLVEIAANGYASATMSSGGGSKSYTRLDVDKIQKTIDILTSKLASYRRMLNDGGSSVTKQIYTVYC